MERWGPYETRDTKPCYPGTLVGYAGIETKRFSLTAPTVVGGAWHGGEKCRGA